jgi:hypothetical protein
LEVEFKKASMSYQTRVDDLETRFGTKPKDLSEEIDAPTSWGVVGNLSSQLTAHEAVTGATIDAHADLFAEVARSRDADLRVLRASNAALEERIEGLMGTFVQIVGGLEGRLDTELSSRNTPAPASVAAFESHPPMSGIPQALLDRLSRLDETVAGLTADQDSEAIRFAGLGFRSMKDANAWMAIHMPSGCGGLVVDVHIVLEHISTAVGTQDLIKRLERIYKIDLTNLTEAVAISSFESRLPKYFTKKSHVGTTNLDTSCLEQITSYENWVDPNFGFALNLKEELVLFEESHRADLENQWDQDSPAYTVAIQALGASVEWVSGLIQFIDEYHKQMKAAGFSVKKSFHLATRLARRLLFEISIPRNQAQNRFAAGDAQVAAVAMFWASLKSHEVMARIKKAGFKNDSAVSAELVKILSTNTAFEEIAAMRETIGKLPSQASISTIGNKLDSHVTSWNKAVSSNDRALSEITKRLAKLEK